MQSEVLHDSFMEFDLINSGVDVTFSLNDNQRFIMSVDGPLSACEVGFQHAKCLPPLPSPQSPKFNLHE
jgi:hypothetical protein